MVFDPEEGSLGLFMEGGMKIEMKSSSLPISYLSLLAVQRSMCPFLGSPLNGCMLCSFSFFGHVIYPHDLILVSLTDVLCCFQLKPKLSAALQCQVFYV